MKPEVDPARSRILLVEDEELLRWSIERYLTQRGYLVESTDDGSQAMSLLAQRPFDVVITDLAVRGTDGLGIAAEARRRLPECQVVIITGQGSKETVIRALRQGVWDYVEKPFDLELLLISVEKALEKTMILRELVHLSRTDGLTGLYNRRHFLQVLEAEIGRARRQERPLSLLVIDVDDFKTYNDRFGHLAGDAALARLASCLKSACRRDVDSAFRYGGDEFVLLLPEAGAATATTVAERVRDLIAAEGLTLTVSIGVAELGEGEEARDLVRAADAAMYGAKDGGGDRVVRFPKAG